MEFVCLEGAELDFDKGENTAPPTVTLILIDKAQLANSIKLEGEVIYQLVELFRDMADRLPPRKAAH